MIGRGLNWLSTLLILGGCTANYENGNIVTVEDLNLSEEEFVVGREYLFLSSREIDSLSAEEELSVTPEDRYSLRVEPIYSGNTTISINRVEFQLEIKEFKSEE
jgi:hypothetical protein